MKPMRGLPSSWLHNMSRERRTALLSLAVLLALLGSLVLYQRFTIMSKEIPLPTPGKDVPVEQGQKVEPSPPIAEDMPVASGTGTAAGTPIPEVTKLDRPVAGTPQVRLRFDDVHQAYGDLRIYSGMAFGARRGDSVLAAGRGTVMEILDDPMDGRVLLIDHGHDLITRYAGLGATLVAKGAAVTAGTIVGQVGDPGPVWTYLGPHIQFQVLVKGEPVNPAAYFPN